jgi:hypothetical protein
MPTGGLSGTGLTTVDNAADQVILKTDWLNSRPVFFATGTGDASHAVNDVVARMPSMSFHPEGLANYLTFGYSVFGQTPVAGIEFLEPCSEIRRTPDGGMSVCRSNDTAWDWIDYRLSEPDVIDLIRARVQAWEAALPADQLIVLPLSGGFDSRLLLWCISEKSRVRAFTYGISYDQARSHEAACAREVCARLGVDWRLVPLGSFNRHIEDWYDWFGISVHAHGMYRIEFYKQIQATLPGTHALLSGIVGDAWAGSICVKPLPRMGDITELGLRHGMHADASALRLSRSDVLWRSFWEDNRERLADQRFRTVATIRMKMLLLCYLLSLPSRFGMQAWSPFLDPGVAMAMLNLPPERRRGRVWQREFFAKVGLDMSAVTRRAHRRNDLNHLGLARVPPPPLDTGLLAPVFDAAYVDWINRNIRMGPQNRARAELLKVPKVRGVLRLLGVEDKALTAYAAYLTLKPVEMLMQRNSFNDGLAVGSAI